MRFFIAMFSLTVFIAGALTGVAALAWAVGPPKMSATVLLNLMTDELRWATTSVRVNLDTWEPGSEAGRHHHPGPTIIYVLEGELEETREGATRTLKAGQAVWNRGKIPHNVVNRTDRPARALAIHLDPGR